MKKFIYVYPDTSLNIAAGTLLYQFACDHLIFPFFSEPLYIKNTSLITGTVTVNHFVNLVNVAIGYIEFRISSAFNLSSVEVAKNRYIVFPMDGLPMTDGDEVSLTGSTCRCEVRNEYGALLGENEYPLCDGTYPEDSKYYADWIANRWKDKPTLSLDTTNTNHNEVSLKGTATYGNEATGFALFDVTSGTEEFIEIVEGATAFEFTTLEEMDAGDYSFKIYPFKGDPDSDEEPELGTPSDVLTVTVSDTDPTVVKT